MLRDSPALDDLTRKRKPVKKSLAIAFSILIVVSAMAMVVPAVIDGGDDVADESPASIKANNGEREVTYTYSHFFESYLKEANWSTVPHANTNFEWLGRHNETLGIENWFTVSGLRDQYQEYVIRDTYPFLFYYSPYSTMTSPDVDVGFNIWAPMRVEIEAKNVTDCNTRNDAYFVPILGVGSDKGGWINMTWYQTYLQTGEMTAIRGGTHYANWFYDAPGGITPRETSDDGYWHELQGLITYDRQAAMGYLGAPSTGDLRTWFNSSVDTIENDWEVNWLNNGSDGGNFDIYTAYDWPQDIRMTAIKIDWHNSTADFLQIRIWCMSWGMDVQFVRYLEAANITKYTQGWYEDMYCNISVGPSMTNMTMRATEMYRLGAYEDPSDNIWSAAWAFEAQHMDWCGNVPSHSSYRSPYNKYDPDITAGVDETFQTRVPGTTTFGQNVSYWIAPMHMNLSAYESIIVDINTPGDVLGVTPYVGTNDTLDSHKTWDLRNHTFWGTLVLGDGCYPKTTIENSYDPATKKITLTGPATFPAERDADWRLYHGVPSFVFDVSRVTQYDVQVTGVHRTTVADTVTVTAKNATSTITDWNGTVDLTCTDSSATLGATSHTYVPADNGVWSTTVTWATVGQWYVNATDNDLPLDLTGSSGPIDVLLIPEFATLLIPVLGMMAIFLVFRTKKRRE